MKWLAAALAVAVLLLQYRVWFSEDGVRELARLRQAVAAQRAENQLLRIEAELGTVRYAGREAFPVKI